MEGRHDHHFSQKMIWAFCVLFVVITDSYCAFVPPKKEKVQVLQPEQLSSHCVFSSDNTESKDIVCDFSEQHSDTFIDHSLTIRFLSFHGKYSFIPSSNYTKNVVSFSVTHSSIKVIDESAFKGFAALKNLDLSNNTIGHIDNNAFVGLKHLETLNLSHNNLRTVDNNWFDTSNNILNIDFSHNTIGFLDKDVFYRISSLVVLKLNDNKISHIKVGAFNKLQNLTRLILNNNVLVSVSASVFEPLISLHILTIENNQWECSCALDSFLEYLHNNSHLDLGSDLARCSSPPSYTGKIRSTLFRVGIQITYYKIET